MRPRHHLEPVLTGGVLLAGAASVVAIAAAVIHPIVGGILGAGLLLTGHAVGRGARRTITVRRLAAGHRASYRPLDTARTIGVTDHDRAVTWALELPADASVATRSTARRLIRDVAGLEASLTAAGAPVLTDEEPAPPAPSSRRRPSVSFPTSDTTTPEQPKP